MAFEDLLTKYGGEQGIPMNILNALVKQESAFNPKAVSPAGAQGLMQLMPGTAKDLGVTDPFDPEQNIRGGTQYLAQQYKKFGDWPKALAAYNAGPGNVQKYGGIPPFKETQNYVQKIMGSLPQEVQQTPQAPQGGEMPQQQGKGLKELLMEQLIPQVQGKMNLGEKIGTGMMALGGLSEGLFGNRDRAQQMYEQARQPMLQRKQGQQSAIKMLMGLGAPGTKPTDDIREYEFAKGQGFQGTFEDWQRSMKPTDLSAMALQDPGGIGSMIKGIIGGLRSPEGGVAQPPASTGVKTFDPATGTFK